MSEFQFIESNEVVMTFLTSATVSDLQNKAIRDEVFTLAKLKISRDYKKFNIFLDARCKELLNPTICSVEISQEIISKSSSSNIEYALVSGLNSRRTNNYYKQELFNERNNADELNGIPQNPGQSDTNEFIEFIRTIGIKYEKRHEENILSFFFYCIARNIINNELFEGKLTYGLKEYKRYLYELVLANKLKRNEYHQRLFSLDLYFRFLARIKDLVFTLEKPIANPLYPLFDDLGCTAFRKFIEELVDKNHLTIASFIVQIRMFLRHLGNEVSKNIESLHPRHIQTFESILMQRVLFEEIKQCSAFTILHHIRRFINFLYRNDYISFQYVVPEKFRPKLTRDNEYVDVESRENFLTYILNSSVKNRKRDFCIVLLFIETGCRPLEISTLRIIDIDIKEHTISLFSKKSRTRTLKVTPFVISVLSDFIKTERAHTLPHAPLFVTRFDAPINTQIISCMIRKYNQVAFSETKFSAKSFRHTYITDALNNRNDFNAVSESVGHKKWCSTMHYLYRSIPTLLSHTLPYNPMTKGNH
ncbi:tyrosine-type recombinase/integrase [Paenibacillus aestuarii]|uniref:Site-specific integrase n=1 Tax=Paenibacillus aestuarii TaxID=516965 RepID=A0ABW0KHE1_9BACL|nr:site-specific integrase [Paenibacillus aestuarii]